jgi:iron complex transport system substrate-binding protein
VVASLLLVQVGSVALTAASAATPPQRIVSLNLCTDQVLIDLVPRERIRALSYLAADPAVSTIADRAAQFRVTRGEAEDVLALDPDLVLAGTWTTPATVDLLRRLERRIEVVPLASDVDGVRGAVRQIAAAVGETARGETMIADFDRRLASIQSAKSGRQPTALIYQISGLASGPGSLADDALTHAGFRNLARDLALGVGGHVDLETLLAHPPDLLVLAAEAAEYRTAAADNLRHPAIAWLRRTRPTLTLPWRQWLCATPTVANAIEQLAAARRELPGNRPAQ